MEETSLGRSQTEVTPKISEITREIEGSGVQFFENAIAYLNKNLEFRNVDASSSEHERRIRWRRTAGEIFEDGYVYKQKSCTDLTITFQALCEAKGYETRFVKLKRAEGRGIHSMAEVKIQNDWYLIDIGGRAGIRKGEFKNDEMYSGWKLWKKGKDSWSVGLDSWDKASLVN